ncbi:MAG: hypothetical protein HQK50_09505 [Oligoflexia bacterium]|nr:hypothetical protein [Oligoflexia bacterium]
MKKISCSHLKLEGDDLLLLLISMLSVFSIWPLVYFWTYDSLAGGNDVFNVYLSYKMSQDHGGTLLSLFYLPSILGGASALPMSNMNEIFIKLGLDPLWGTNLQIFLPQVFFGYIATRMAYDLHLLLRPKQPFPNIHAKNYIFSTNYSHVLLLIGVTLFFAFNPILGVRSINGHQNLIWGSLMLVSFLALALAFCNKRLTITLMITTLFSFSIVFLSGQQQMSAYTLVFGLPILFAFLLGINFSFKKKVLSLLFATLIGLLAIALTADYWVNYLIRILSDETWRGLSTLTSENFIYSYTTATANDWISSLFLGHNVYPSPRAYGFLHETNYPLGPIIIFSLLGILYRPTRTISWGILVSGVMSILFSSRFDLFVTPLIKTFPFLSLFRVPARSFMIFALMQSIVAISILLATYQAERIKFITTGVLSLSLFIILSSTLPREILIWLLALPLIVVIGKNLLPWKIFAFADRLPLAISTSAIPIALVFLLGMGNIMAIKDRLYKFTSSPQLFDSLAKTQEKIQADLPLLKNPFNRAILTFEHPIFLFNTPSIMNISSINGTFIASKRFVTLLSVLRGVEIPPSEIYFKIFPEDPAYDALTYLYNVKYLLSLKDHTLLYQENNTTHIWAVDKAIITPDWNTLAQQLKKASKGKNKQIYKKAFILAEDLEKSPYKSKLAIKTPPSQCSTAAFSEFRQQSNSFAIDSDFKQNSGDCLTIISTNYSKSLQVFIYDQENKKNLLPTIPINGALLGMIVPSNTKKIVITPTFYNISDLRQNL